MKGAPGDPQQGSGQAAWPAFAAASTFVLVFAIDWLASPAVPFGPYYLIPVAISAWYLGTAWAALAVAAASLARTYVLSRLFRADWALLYATDVATSLALYAATAFLLARLRRSHRQLAGAAQHLRAQAGQLEERLRLQWSIRRAVASDLDAIMALAVVGAQTGDLSKEILEQPQHDAVRANYANGIRSGMTVRRTWHATEARVPIEVWVSHLDGAVAGCFIVMGIDEQDGGGRELHAIVTATTSRGRGVGSAMLDFFCAHYHGRRLYAACMPEGRMHRMLTQRGFGQFADTKQGYVIVGRPDWVVTHAQDGHSKPTRARIGGAVLEQGLPA